MKKPSTGGAPRLAARYAKQLEGRCRKPRVRDAIAWAMTGESLREAAGHVGWHPSTLHEALRRYGLEADWKRARVERTEREQGSVPPLWRRHVADVA
jgi:hypothetical protein